MSFIKITLEVLRENQILFDYLNSSSINQSRKGQGIFIGGGIASDKLRGFGIVLPKGGMIIPNDNPERISGLIKKLTQEKAETVRLKREQQQAEEKKADDKYLAHFQSLCDEFPQLGLSVKELCHDDGRRFGAVIIDSEDRHIFAIITSGTTRPTLEEARQAFEKELTIRDFRVKNTARIIVLNEKLQNAHAREIRIRDWRDDVVSVAFSNPEYWFPHSHSLSFNNKVEWSEDDLSRLEKEVEARIIEVEAPKNEALKKLHQYNIVGASVKAFGWSSSRERTLPTRLEVNGETIEFPTIEHAKEAEDWALKQGAFLPHHHSVGEQWRNLAKSENWDERRCKLVVSILNGEAIKERSYSVQCQHLYNGKGTGQFYSSSQTGWSLAGFTPLANEEIDFLRDFAKKANVDFKMLTKAEEETKIKAEAFQQLTVRVVVYNVRTRNTSWIVAEAEGSFEKAVSQVRDKINPEERPRRRLSLSISVLSPKESGLVGRRFGKSFSVGQEAINFLAEVNKNEIFL